MFVVLAEMQAGKDAYVRNGGKLGRKRGTSENIQTFLNKPKSQEIVSLLRNGKSVRDIAGRLKCSLNTVVKVRKYLDLEST